MFVNLEGMTQLSKRVERALQGEEVIIGRAGVPVARLVPYVPHPEPRRPGALKGRIEVADDFDRTPDWMIDAFEGRG